MGPIGCPETSVTNYKSTLRNITEKGLSHFYGSRSLRSSIIITASFNRYARNSEKTDRKPRGDSTAYIWFSKLVFLLHQSALHDVTEEGRGLSLKSELQPSL
jgi:hypothetical protein